MEKLRFWDHLLTGNELKAVYKIYLYTFPFAHAFAITGAVNFSVVMGIILVLGVLVFPSRQKLTPHIIDIAIGIFFLSLIFSNIINIFILDQKQINHTISWFVCFLLFFYVNRFYIKCITIDEVYKIITRCYILVTTFCVVEFLSRLVLDIDLNNYLPRPDGENYDATFLGFILQRSRAFFSESGHAGMYLALTYPFVLYWMKERKASILRKTAILFLTVSAAFTIFSTTFFIFIPIFYFLIFKLSSRQFYKSLLLLLPVSVMAIYVFWNELYLVLNAVILSKFQMGSADIRQTNMTANLDYIKQSPLLHILFGNGPGSYFKLGLPDAAPSVYVNVLRDIGIVGLSAYCFLWVVATITVFSKKQLKISKYMLLMVSMILVYHISNMEYNFATIWFVLFAITKMEHFSLVNKNIS